MSMTRNRKLDLLTEEMYAKSSDKRENKITFVPPLRDNEEGWLNINGESIRITNTHHYDDFGQELLTYTLEDGSEYESCNDWHFREV